MGGFPEMELRASLSVSQSAGLDSKEEATAPPSVAMGEETRGSGPR